MIGGENPDPSRVAGWVGVQHEAAESESLSGGEGAPDTDFITNN